jgi:hypothetical protein
MVEVGMGDEHEFAMLNLLRYQLAIGLNPPEKRLPESETSEIWIYQDDVIVRTEL